MKTLCVLLTSMLFLSSTPVRAGTELKIQTIEHLVNWHGIDSRGSSIVNDGTVQPLRGGGRGYASSDPATIRSINNELLEADIVGALSWWGPAHDDVNSTGDIFWDKFLNIPGTNKVILLYEVTARLKLSVIGRHENGKPIEVYDFNDPWNAQRFSDDMEHLHAKYFSRPEYQDRFYKINGKPVVFIWLSHAFYGRFDIASAQVPHRKDLYIIGSNFNLVGTTPAPGDTSVFGGLDAISAYGTYDWQLAERLGIPKDADGKYHMTAAYVDAYVKSVGKFSYWLSQYAPHVRLILPMTFSYEDNRPGNVPMTSTREEAEHFARTIRAIIVESAENCRNILAIVLGVSYNEHYEGTSIEPTVEYGYDFFNIVKSFKEPVAIAPTGCTPLT